MGEKMEFRSVTTPFGRRQMTLGMLASQKKVETIEPGITRNRWKLFRAICEARPALGVTDRALNVLDALLTFYPDNELSEARGLIVFPSNVQLCIRAKGMTPATLRRHLAGLVEAGLINRKDSSNGKRYARRDEAGAVSEAFGFSLAPLLARATEIEALAAQAVADRELLRATKARLTICRRDVAKLLAMALEEGAAGDWGMIAKMFRDILARVPRSPRITDLTATLDEMTLLREEVVNRLEICVKTSIIDAKESQIEHHIQNSNPEGIYESEPAVESEQDEKSASGAAPLDASGTEIEIRKAGVLNRLRGKVGDRELKSFPLGMVLQACPQIVDYGPGGQIGTWRDLMNAAVVVRSTLGVSPSAYQDACSAMGPENAATVMACILERGGHINSAGGYLRDLTRRTESAEFAIGPMLMSLVRQNGHRSGRVS